MPFTKIAVEVTVVPEIVFAFKELPVALPKVSVEKLAVLAFRETPVAFVNPREPVNKFVEVTEAKVEEPVTFKSPATLRVPVTEEEAATRSEEHTSELQSQSNLVCRL